jgi:para-nitrobenzyl esterase
LATIAVLATTASAHGVVRTDKGPVRGVETQTVQKYLGIPYAAPPVGDLRWRPPQAPDRWRAVRDASQFGSHCPQTASPYGFESDTEDCLYLNVFAPNKQQSRRRGRGHGRDKELPVMVWLHGGGLTVGESDDYNPTRLVQQGVIVVTVNYRLGYLGFLAHPALSAESGGKGSGNYGLMDQQAALRWVQRNIGRFGGDEDKVTIFGQSAGGLSVHSHLVSPRSKGLFDRAIAQSGAYTTTLPSLTAAESSGTTAAQNFGCPDQSLACLRATPVHTMLAVQPAAPGAIVPNIDGNVLTSSIGPALASGNFNHVPVIEGATHDEFTIFEIEFVESMVGEVTPFLYPLVVQILDSTVGLPPTAEQILAEYPVTAYPSAGEAVAALATDAIFACPDRRIAGSLSKFGRAYQYELDDPNVPQIFIPPGHIPTKTYHAADTLFLFDSDLRGGHAPFTADEESLAAAMVGYWARFARTGTPNRKDLPQWPAYTTATDTHMSLQPPTPQAQTDFAADHHCGFWDSFESAP